MSKDIPEIIVTMILDKLISNICRDEYIKVINSKIGNHCNDFIQKLLSPYLSNLFLFHENGLDKIENDDKKIFYKRIKPKKVNTWISFKEPNSNLIDRYACNKNKLSEYHENKTDLKKRNSILIQNEAMNEQKEFDKEKEKIKKTKKIKIKLKDIWKKENNNILIKKSITTNNLFNSKNITKGTSNNEINKRKKEEVLEIPGTYIPYEKKELINLFLNDTEENNLLRKERELKIIEKEEILKKNQKIKKDKPKINRFLVNKKFDNDKLTFDSNGNIIKLHLPYVDSFNQDFILSNSKIKENKEQFLSIPTDIHKNQKKEIKINRKILKSIENNIKISSQLIKPKNINIENNNIKEIIEYNPEDREIEFYKTKKNRPELIYSGSNFDKISPEIGVIISNDEINNKNGEKNEKDKNGQEKSNIKIGGFEYIKKYNRPSMNELSYLFSNQNINMNNNEFNNNQITSFFNYDYSHNNNDNNLEKIDNYKKYNSEFNTINNENNYIGYKEEFNDNNPLFQDAFQIQEDPQINTKKNKVSPLFPIKLKNLKSKSNQSIFNPIIRINKSQIKDVYYKNSLSTDRNNLIKNKSSFQGANMNTNDKLISFNNNILLSQNFNSPNLKSIFLDDNEKYENYLSTDENKTNKNNNNIRFNSIDYKINNENINVIYPLKNLRYRKNILPSIIDNNKKNKYSLEQNYINKFNLGIVKNKNWGNDLDEQINDNKNSYKEQYLRQQNRFLNNQIKIKKRKIKENII